MKKSIKIFGGIVLASIMALGAFGCADGKDIFKANFDNGNNYTFGVYGTVVDNADKTITIKKDTTDNNGASTYFKSGIETPTANDKNTNWVEGGVNVSLDVYLDENAVNDTGFNFTVALNGTEKTFISERSIYVKKYSTGFRAGYVFNGSSEELNSQATAVANTTSKALEKGWNKIVFKFYTNANKEILADISIGNKNASFTQTGAVLANSEGTAIKETNISGLRYGWFSWMNMNSIKVDNLSVRAN